MMEKEILKKASVGSTGQCNRYDGYTINAMCRPLKVCSTDMFLGLISEL